MLTMDQIHHIRALYYEQGYNISEIAEATGRDWKTVWWYRDRKDDALNMHRSFGLQEGYSGTLFPDRIIGQHLVIEDEGRQA